MSQPPANENRPLNFSNLVGALKGALSELQQELDERIHSGNDEEFASLENVVSEVKAALAEVEAAQQESEA